MTIRPSARCARLARSTVAQAAILIVLLLVPVSAASAASPRLWTGLPDYHPDTVVDLHGDGFQAGTSYAVAVRRPDGSIVLVDPRTHAARPGWDIVAASADGTLSYGYQLDGIQGLYEARAYPAGWSGDWSQAPVTSVTFTDKASADIDQCANGTGVVTSCPGSGGGGDWQNGNLNQNNSRFHEGDTVAFRQRFEGVTGTNTVTISWLVVKSPKHAYDYLTTWKRTVTGVDPCQGVAGCVLASPTSTFAIPTDPTLAAACGFSGFQVPGVFTMWGGIITSVSAYSQTGCAPTGSDQSNSITITFTATTSTPVLAWGGHLAAEANWGAGSAASSIPGSSYHMSQDDCSFQCGSQDRSIQTGGSVILPVPAIATTADPTTLNVSNPVTDTAIITGTVANGFPSGTVDFYWCGPNTNAPDCTLGGTFLGTSAVTPTQVNPASIGTATSPAFYPSAQGTYCFRAVYNPDSAASYSSFVHTDQTLECFLVGNPVIVQTGSLRISKILDSVGSGFDTFTEFAIRYSCDNGGPAGTISLAGGASQTISNIPVGSVCTVTEPTQPSAPIDYSWTVGVSGSPTAAIIANQTKSVTVTNSLSPTVNAQSGSLYITKTLDASGSGFDPTTTFTISYDCGGGFAGTLHLAGGDQATISGIPEGSVCTVSESNLPAAPAGYSWSVVITGSPTAPTTAGQTEWVDVANSLSHTTGSLLISKTLDVNGSNFNTSTAFSIAYDCGGGISGTVSLAGGQSQTISNIPTGSICAVTEPTQPAAPTGYHWSVVITGSPTAAISAGQTESVTVANSLVRDTGSLQISKTLDVNGSNFNTSTAFSIAYDCGGGISGTVSLAGGQSQTISNIPTGSICAVTEPTQPAAPTGYHWSVVITGSPTAAISAGQTESVTVANSLTRDTGSLLISKTLAVNGAPFIASTPFSISYVCGSVSGSVSLAGGQSEIISNIPTGSVCTVSEPSQPPAPAGYSWSVVITGSPTKAISAGQSESVIVANTLTRDTGSLRISKNLVLNGSTFNTSTLFSITYNCGGGISGTVSLAGGQSTTISNIPTGSGCTVGESIQAAAPGQYVWWAPVVTGSGVTITKAATADATVTNTLGPTCKEDPSRAGLLTRTVITTNPAGGGTGQPGSPINYLTVQAAYDAAKASAGAEVIGLYSKTTENLLLDGSKSLTITQCVSAQVTAAVATKPVWDITSTGKLLIISPDAVGGTIGWRIATGGHDIRSVRASNATQYGILIAGSGNSVSFNSVSGSPEGIRIQGSSNDVRGGTVSNNTTGVNIIIGATGNTFRTATVGPNKGNGVVVAGSGNTVRDDIFTANVLNGVLVSGANNTIYNNSSYANTADGFNVTGTGIFLDTNKAYKNKGDGFEIGTAASGSKLKGNEGNTGSSGSSSENAGCEYRLGYAITNLGGNKKDNVAFTATAKGNYE